MCRFRNLEELLAPIKTDEHLGKAFRLEQAKSIEAPVPFNVGLAETGDKALWARSYTGFLRAFTEAILAWAFPDSLPRADTLDKIYQQVEARLTAILPLRVSLHIRRGIAHPHLKHTRFMS